MSLRERKKERKRVAMLDASRELLRRDGYDKTSMEAIAEQAEVGVATVYKYFGTKEVLVMETIRTEMLAMLEEVEGIVADPPENVVDAVIAVLVPATNLELARDRGGLVRQVITRMWQKREDIAREFMGWVGSEMEQHINTVLVDFQGRGEFKEGADTRLLARVIFSLLDYNYICFSRGEFETVEEINELIFAQVRELLEY